jgi:adenylate kinase family enzyme
VSPRAAVVQLLGYPGTGKYTVARELVRQMEAAGRSSRLLDNHASANLVLSLVPTPTSGIPDDVMDRIVQVREAVLATLETLTPRDWSIVFTNFPPDAARARALDRHRELAERRGSSFLPVLLECDPDEVLRRVVDAERAERHKLVDPARMAEILADPVPLPPWDRVHRLDVTSRPPAEAARAILELLPR